MKKILFIATLALMGCSPATHDPLIVTKVHVEGEGASTKFTIDINNTGWTVFTNHKYQVGDTIK